MALRLSCRFLKLRKCVSVYGLTNNIRDFANIRQIPVLLSSEYSTLLAYPNQCVDFLEIDHPHSSLLHQRRLFSSFPSHTVIKLPNLSPTMETGTIVSWAKNEGDEVGEGDLLAEIETDKATMSFDASDPGFLAKILAPAGSKDIPIGTPLCVIVEDASDMAAFKEFTAADVSGAPKAPQASSAPAEPAPAAPPKPASPTSTPPPAPIPTAQPGTGQRVFASPLARRLAAEQGLNLSQLAASKPGTGIQGMIRAADLAGVQPSGFGAPVGGFTQIPVSNLRSMTANRMTESQVTVPHYYLTADIEMEAALNMREQVNATLSKRASKVEGDAPKITLNDILIKAVAATCLKVPECNSSWQGEFIRQYNTVDVNVSIATPEGLITPIVFGAETKGMLQINQEVRSLTDKAKEGQLQPHEVQGGTFTLSNLGMFGVSSFSAIISPPQACLLAVGSTQEQLFPDNNAPSGFKSKHFMSVTLCCDHRVVDGAVGATWLAEFKSALENPALMLI